jgi:ATP-binding cassette, subfamily B, bacterial PglK
MVSALWRLLDSPQKRQLVALQLLSLLMALTTVGGLAAILPFFTVLADPGAVHRSRLLQLAYDRLSFATAGPGGEIRFAFALGIAFALLVALANAVNLAGTILMNRFAHAVGNAFNCALFEEYLSRDYEFHARTDGALLTSRLLHETSRVTTGVLQGGLVLATSVATVALIVGSVVWVGRLVALLALAVLGVAYLLIYTAARGRLLRNGAQESRHYVDRTRVVGESLGGIREIILLRAQPFFVAVFARCCRSISRTIVGTLAIAQAPRHALEIVTVLALVGGALYMRGGEQAQGQWVASITFMGLAAYRLLPSLQQGFAALVNVRANWPAFESIAQDLHQAQTRTRSRRPQPDLESWRGRPRREIRFEQVSFRYSAGASEALCDLSLRIPSGAMIGLMGENGSGKTTLADVMAGLLVPQSGHLEVDGIIVDESNREAWRSTIAYVPQQVFVLDASVAENIALGRPDPHGDRERLDAAVRLARLEECVARLPGGLDERLGERGGRLSGGQRQRLGLARALYRGASVLIMDEATSGLDAAAEEDIVEALAALRGRCTIIMIAHRVSALRRCGLIHELALGRLVRSLRYEGLIQRPGRAVPAEP